MFDSFAVWSASLLIPVALVPLALLLSTVGTRAVGPISIMLMGWLHIGLGMLRYSMMGLWAPDAIGYDRLAQQAALALNGDSTIEVTEGKQGWPLLLGRIYSILGPNPLFGIALASVGVVITAWLISQATAVYSGPKAARWAFFLVSLGPPFLLWGDSLLRESAVWFTIALTLLGRALLFKGGRPVAGFLLMTVGLLALLTVRGTLAAILAFSLAISALLVARTRGGAVGKPLAIATLTGFLVVGPIAINQAAGYFGYDLETVNASRESLARTSSTSFGTVSSISSVSDVGRIVFTVLPRASLGPFPWEIGGLGGIALLADAALCWAILFVLWRGRRHLSSELVLSHVPPGLALLAALAVTSGNYGTLVRIRAGAVLILVPLIATALAARRTADTDAATEPALTPAPHRQSPEREITHVTASSPTRSLRTNHKSRRRDHRAGRSLGSA